jgi:hypothetical protein
MFDKPVNPEEVPDYYNIIAYPMDFCSMLDKIDNGLYIWCAANGVCVRSLSHPLSPTVFFALNFAWCRRRGVVFALQLRTVYGRRDSYLPQRLRVQRPQDAARAAHYSRVSANRGTWCMSRSFAAATPPPPPRACPPPRSLAHATHCFLPVRILTPWPFPPSFPPPAHPSFAPIDCSRQDFANEMAVEMDERMGGSPLAVCTEIYRRRFNQEPVAEKLHEEAQKRARDILLRNGPGAAVAAAAAAAAASSAGGDGMGGGSGSGPGAAGPHTGRSTRARYGRLGSQDDFYAQGLDAVKSILSKPRSKGRATDPGASSSAAAPAEDAADGGSAPAAAAEAACGDGAGSAEGPLAAGDPVDPAADGVDSGAGPAAAEVKHADSGSEAGALGHERQMDGVAADEHGSQPAFSGGPVAEMAAEEAMPAAAAVAAVSAIPAPASAAAAAAAEVAVRDHKDPEVDIEAEAAALNRELAGEGLCRAPRYSPPPPRVPFCPRLAWCFAPEGAK